MLSVGVLKVASFQVVLAYNVHRSFILIYYGDVAETGLPWQVSEVAYCLLCTVQTKKTTTDIQLKINRSFKRGEKKRFSLSFFNRMRT